MLVVYNNGVFLHFKQFVNVSGVQMQYACVKQCCRVGSRSRGSQRFLQGVGVRVDVEKRILPESGVGVKKYMTNSRLQVVHKI